MMYFSVRAPPLFHVKQLNAKYEYNIKGDI